jgi:trigger factor
MTKVQLNEVQIENGEGGEVTLLITVPAKQVQKTRQQVLREYARRVRIPGFRPGHAPIGIMRRTIGDDNISQALSDELVPAAYQQAVENKELQPLVRAEVDDLKFDAFDTDADMSFNAKLILRPEVKMGEVSELTATRNEAPVTEEEVDEQIERILEENASFENVEDRGAEHHDILMGEMTAVVDGVARTEEPERLRPFRLGHSDTIPPIDEHLEGIKIDEERTFKATYPEDFEDKELAGKEAEFTVKITAIKERKVAELNDEFVKKIGLESVDELREKIREGVASQHEREARDDVRNQITRAAAEAAELEIPQKLVERRVADRKNQKEAELKRADKKLEDFLSESDKTQEAWEAELTEEENIALREDLVLDEVARKNELTVPTEELEDYFVNLAQMLQQPIEDVVKRFDVQAVHASLLRQKAVDWLVDQAKVEGAEAEEETAAV